MFLLCACNINIYYWLILLFYLYNIIYYIALPLLWQHLGSKHHLRGKRSYAKIHSRNGWQEVARRCAGACRKHPTLVCLHNVQICFQKKCQFNKKNTTFISHHATWRKIAERNPMLDWTQPHPPNKKTQKTNISSFPAQKTNAHKNCTLNNIRVSIKARHILRVSFLLAS